MLNHKQILRKLNLAAQNVHHLEFIYSEIATRMVDRLDYIKLTPKLILDIGSGLNIDANLLSKKYPDALIYKVDLALNILKLSKEKKHGFWQREINNIIKKIYCNAGGHGGKLGYAICADALNLPIMANSMDIVWSNLTLPYIDELEIYFKEVRRALNLGGCFIVSGLGVDSMQQLRKVGLRTYNFPDMHLIGDILVKLGFTNPVMDMEYITLEYDNFKLLLEDVRTFGIGSAILETPNSYLTKDVYNNLAQKFAQLTCNGKVPLTLELFYAHAWKDKLHLDLGENKQGIQFYPKKL